MRITALEHQARRRRVVLHLDTSSTLALSPDIRVRYGLHVGDEVSKARLAEITEAQARHAAMEFALRLIAYRPRSEAELHDRLARRGVEADVLEATVSRVRELRLIDDEAFARSLTESRDRTSPRGRKLIAAELRAKGIDRGVAALSVATLDDEDAAYRAASRRASSLKALPYEDFRRKLTDFLLRRAFGHEIARGAVARICEESGRRPDAEASDDA